MRSFLLLALVVLTFASTAIAQSGHGGGECRMPFTNVTLPCPEYNYTTVGRVELRHYYENEIATSGATSRNIVHGIEDAAFPLFEYFNGSNAGGVKIRFTIPFAAHITPRLATHNVEDIWFLPREYIGKAPKPTSPNVTVADISPRGRVGVHRWVGEGVDTERIFGEMEFLEGELRRERIEYVNTSFIFASYDVPEVREKVFEVWAFLA